MYFQSAVVNPLSSLNAFLPPSASGNGENLTLGRGGAARSVLCVGGELDGSRRMHGGDQLHLEVLASDVKSKEFWRLGHVVIWRVAGIGVMIESGMGTCGMLKRLRTGRSSPCTAGVWPIGPPIMPRCVYFFQASCHAFLQQGDYDLSAHARKASSEPSTLRRAEEVRFL